MCLQVGGGSASVTQIITDTYRTGGAGAFFRGNLINVLRTVPSKSIQVIRFDEVLHTFFSFAMAPPHQPTRMTTDKISASAESDPTGYCTVFIVSVHHSGLTCSCRTTTCRCPQFFAYDFYKRKLGKKNPVTGKLEINGLMTTLSGREAFLVTSAMPQNALSSRIRLLSLLPLPTALCDQSFEHRFGPSFGFCFSRRRARCSLERSLERSLARSFG